MTNNVFWTQKLTRNNNKTKSKHKTPGQSRESDQGPVAPQSDALPLDQLNILIKVKLFNCFNENGRNINN